MRNVTGPPVMGDDLYGRQQAIDQLWSRLGGGEHLLMLAPRRVGKTSLMRELHRDPRTNWEVVYVDVEGADGAADFVASVLAALAELRGNQSWAETIGLPHAVKDALTSFTKGKVKLNLLVVQLKGLIRRDWVQTMDRLETRLSRLPNQRRLLIIVDELPILISRMLESKDGRDEAALLLAKLRHWRLAPALNGKVQMVLGGSIGLEGVLRRASLSASINDLSPFRVASWDRQTAASFLELVGQSNGLPLAAQWIDRMLDLLRDPVPYHVQLFFAALRDTCGEHQGTPSACVVDQCFDQRLTGAAGTPHLDHYAARLEFAFGPPELGLARTVLAIACQQEDGATRAKIATASEPASVLGEVLQTLEADGYLVRKGDRVAFRSNLLRVWWRKHRAAAS